MKENLLKREMLFNCYEKLTEKKKEQEVLTCASDEQQRMESSFVALLALRLMSEEDMTRSEAFRQAHLTRRLLAALGEGVVAFSYRKQDGTVRQAVGTLCKGVSAEFDSYERKTDDRNDGEGYDEKVQFVYWDLERRAFRTFSAAALNEMNHCYPV